MGVCFKNEINDEYIYKYNVINGGKVQLSMSNIMFYQEESELEDYKRQRNTFFYEMRKKVRREVLEQRRMVIKTKKQQETVQDNNKNQQQDRESKEKQQQQGQNIQTSVLKQIGLRSNFGEQQSKFIEQFDKLSHNLDHLPIFVQFVNEIDLLNNYLGVRGIRKILTQIQVAPIQNIIDQGVVPRMLEFIKNEENHQLQYEATWVISIIACGTIQQCQSIMDKGGIPLFISLLKSKNKSIIDQSIWLIGNLSSNCNIYRDQIIQGGGMKHLINICQSKDSNHRTINNACWAISNLCRGKPFPKYSLVKDAVVQLCRIIALGILDDEEILAGCIWAISHHTSQRNKCSVLITSKILPTLLSNIYTSNTGLLIAIIRLIGNITIGIASQTQILIDLDISKYLFLNLFHTQQLVKLQTCWVFSNIAAGQQCHVDYLLKNEELMAKIQTMSKSQSNSIKRQIAHIYSKMAHRGSSELVQQLFLSIDIIDKFISYLNSQDIKLMECVLDCLFIVLQFGDNHKQQKNVFIERLRELKAIQLLQQLQYHKSNVVYNRSHRILQTFFQAIDPISDQYVNEHY